LRRVDRDGPAERAGLQVGDELLAVDGHRIRADADLSRLLGVAERPQALEVLFCRDGRIRQASLRPDPPVVVRWHLQSLENPEAATLDRRQRWLELQP
jgi:predicted metalloprotease with PDZ domain